MVGGNPTLTAARLNPNLDHQRYHLRMHVTGTSNMGSCVLNLADCLAEGARVARNSQIVGALPARACMPISCVALGKIVFVECYSRLICQEPSVRNRMGNLWS